MTRYKFLLLALVLAAFSNIGPGFAGEKVKALIPVRNIDESLAPFPVAKYLGY